MALEYGTGGNEEAMLHTRDRYAEGYKAGRKAALREAIALCERHEDMMGAAEGEMRHLLDEAESGEAGEVEQEEA